MKAWDLQGLPDACNRYQAGEASFGGQSLGASTLHTHPCGIGFALSMTINTMEAG